VDVTRDEAVRVVAEAICVGPGACSQCRNYQAPDAVAALIAAGWGDLTAERERLARAVEGYGNERHQHLSVGPSGACNRAAGDRCDLTAAYRHAARLIRETPEAPAQMTDTEWHAKRARALGHKTPGETP
jgi:hypothetical protein